MKTIGVNEHDLVGELYFQSPHSVTCEWILCGLLSNPGIIGKTNQSGLWC